ncbi:hypothetical protein E2C01_081351 [Portunus trituberculatus]|uniref:Uncharacterized protein n=1 Tax=Portunus trituberculatus TaxID=210409 RepID=A0A5B7IM08_PORTR|nr:hypothetical protein [Portunus trituberculatus]
MMPRDSVTTGSREANKCVGRSVCLLSRRQAACGASWGSAGPVLNKGTEGDGCNGRSFPSGPHKASTNGRCCRDAKGQVSPRSW